MTLSPLTVSGAGIQSALSPSGSSAEKIVEMTEVMIVAGALILGLVIAFTAYAIVGRRRRAMGRKFVVGLGIVFPLVTLSALLIYTFDALRDTGGAPALRIEIVGEQWWWRVRYGDVVTANEIHIPVGQPIEFELKSSDVIHSFWVPNLAGKVDMIPGRTNRLRVRALAVGVSRGQCAEYCGTAHAKMAFNVIAESPADFVRWLDRERASAREPDTPLVAHGKRLFLDHACATCHAVRGTPANGQLGPDLTHVGGRTSLGAGSLPNNRGTLAGWIASSQHLKPGNRMPSFDIFTGEELQALAAYMESLQ